MSTRRPSRPLTPDEPRALLGDLVAVVGALNKRTRADPPRRGTITVLELARDRAAAFAPGVRAAALAGGRSSGTVADPTGAAVVAAERRRADADGNERHAGWRTDPTAFYAVELATTLRAAVVIMGRLAALVTAINAHADPELNASTGRRVARLGAGLCRACDHDAPGTPDDRLRGGLCDPCRQRHRRGDWPDLVAFVRARRLELGLDPLHPDTEADRTVAVTAGEEATP
jgi:hypothetical protein